jgi:hypothetical protein
VRAEPRAVTRVALRLLTAPSLRRLVVAWAILFASRAAADPASIVFDYSPYEWEAIHDAEVVLGSRLDPSPEGKTIERIDFVRLDPIDRHDPLPMSVNVVHTTSRVQVLRHEILAREGDPWRRVIIDESARNLRLLPQISLVLCLPMRGSSDDRVRLVVITKDVWSLYVDFDVQGTSGGLELLDLEPKETNVAGLQHTALARFVLTPKTYALGASYEIPRLEGRWLDLFLDANLVVGRDSAQPEGAYGTARITRPLYSTRSEWAWSTEVDWTDELIRRYENARVWCFPEPAPGAACPVSPDHSVQFVWRQRTVIEQAKVTRSFGWEYKDDFSLGALASHSFFGVPEDASPDATLRADFQRTDVPVGENRAGPFLQWHGYTSNYLRVFDLDTLGLQEDVRLGHDLWVRAYPIYREKEGGTGAFLMGVYAAACYTVPFGDGVARVSVESTTEKDAADHTDADGISDASVGGAFHVVSPSLGIGRLISTTSVLNRWRNSLNARSYMGDESLLRGYPTRYFFGKDLVATNLELRSRGIDLAAIQLGGAVFYDVGNAFDGFDNLRPKHDVGFGLRVVFPQFSRDVLRFDFGFPLPASEVRGDVQPFEFFFAFHQSVSVSLPTVGSTYAP